jgi:hypothetical protein
MDTNAILEKKVILAGFVIGASALLTWFGHLQPVNFQEVAIWVVGLTVAGDAANLWASYMSATVVAQQTTKA